MLTKTDLQQIRSVVQEEIAPVKKSLAKIEQKLDDTTDYFDKKFLNHEKRIKTIEEHLDINPAI